MPAATLPASTRTPRARRANRTVLALLGLLLFAAGVAGVAAGFGAFGNSFRNQKVIDENYRDWVASHDWFWLAVAVGSLLVALLALRWLLTQATSSRVGSLELEPDRRAGHTILAAGAVTDAVSTEMASYRGVEGASAYLLGSRGAPTLLVHATLDATADLGEVRRRIEAGAVAHARQALDKPDLPVRLEIRLAANTRRRLH